MDNERGVVVSPIDRCAFFRFLFLVGMKISCVLSFFLSFILYFFYSLGERILVKEEGEVFGKGNCVVGS